MKHGFAVVIVLALLGCRETPSELGQAEDVCGAAELQSLVGQNVAALGDRSVRLIPPGTAITKDYRTERLNADLDAPGGTILRLWCG